MFFFCYERCQTQKSLFSPEGFSGEFVVRLEDFAEKMIYSTQRGGKNFEKGKHYQIRSMWLRQHWQFTSCYTVKLDMQDIQSYLL